MSFGETSEDAIPQFKKFVSEAELDEKRRTRQEEWEKVRQPEQPLEAPEEEYDPRCLFDKLEDQKMKKQEEFDEEHKLKNQVRGLDDDEAGFLEHVSEQQMAVTKARQQEENALLMEYRSAMSSSTEPPSSDKKIPAVQSAAPGQKKKSQMSMLAGAIKRKGSDATSPTEKKPRTDSGPDEKSTGTSGADADADADADVVSSTTVLEPRVGSSSSTVPAQESDERAGIPSAHQRARVVAVLPPGLPGLGAYSDSSDSQSSSSDSDIQVPDDVFSLRKKIESIVGAGHAH